MYILSSLKGLLISQHIYQLVDWLSVNKSVIDQPVSLSVGWSVGEPIH